MDWLDSLMIGFFSIAGIAFVAVIIYAFAVVGPRVAAEKAECEAKGGFYTDSAYGYTCLADVKTIPVGKRK